VLVKRTAFVVDVDDVGKPFCENLPRHGWKPLYQALLGARIHLDVNLIHPLSGEAR